MTGRRTRAVAVAAAVVSSGWALGALLAMSAPAAAEPAIALPGEPIEGSGQPASPTPVTAGSWQLLLGPGEGAHQFFEYARVSDRSTVHVSVLGSVRTDDLDGVGVVVTTPNGEDCGSGDGFEYGRDALAFAGGVSVGLEPDDEGIRDDELDPCLTSDALRIEVTRGSSDSTSDLDALLTVVEEAPVRTHGGLPDSTDVTEEVSISAGGEPQAVAGGSLAEPVEAESGDVIEGTVRTGSAAVYRVRLDWGQTLDARLTVPAVEDAFAGFGVTILDPTFLDGYAVTTSGSVSASERAVATARTGPVRYLNRLDRNAPYLPGSYYLVVGADVISGAQQRDLDYTLELEVRGERDGDPDYGTDEPFVVAEDSTSDMVEVTAQGSGWTVLRAAAVAGLTLAGLAGIGAGIGLLLRRRVPGGRPALP